MGGGETTRRGGARGGLSPWSGDCGEPAPTQKGFGGQPPEFPQPQYRTRDTVSFAQAQCPLRYGFIERLLDLLSAQRSAQQTYLAGAGH